jgi:hypothetical protein
MAEAKTEQVVIRLTPEQAAQLRSRADEEERSVAQVVRFALREYLSSDDARTPA